MGGKKPLRRPLWPPTRATASNCYPLGLDGAGGAAKPLLRAPKKPAPLHGRLPAFSGAVDAFERARKCFLEWRYFFSIILSEFLKNRVALQSIFRTLAFDELSKCKKESASCSVNPPLTASDRNILTRESRCPQVCSGEFCWGDFCDVGCIPFILLHIMNGSVTAVGILVDLTMPHTAHPAQFKALAETADAGKEVKECHLRHRQPHSSNAISSSSSFWPSFSI